LAYLPKVRTIVVNLFHTVTLMATIVAWQLCWWISEDIWSGSIAWGDHTLSKGALSRRHHTYSEGGICWGIQEWHHNWVSRWGGVVDISPFLLLYSRLPREVFDILLGWM
jgi:hypothetical protein